MSVLVLPLTLWSRSHLFWGFDLLLRRTSTEALDLVYRAYDIFLKISSDSRSPCLNSMPIREQEVNGWSIDWIVEGNSFPLFEARKYCRA